MWRKGWPNERYQSLSAQHQIHGVAVLGDWLQTVKLIKYMHVFTINLKGIKDNGCLISHCHTRELEKAMATHSSTLAWKIPWMEEPGRLQSMGLLRVGHDWATSLSLSCTGEGNGNPLQCSCLENPRDRGAWWAAVYGVTQSQTWLKRLSSSSSSSIQGSYQYEKGKKLELT